MTPKERMLHAMHKKKTDKIPWAAYPILVPRGRVEREVRNKGCGLLMFEPTYQVARPKVTVEEKEIWNENNRAKLITRIYHTPLGSVFEKAEIRLNLSPNKSQWIKEYMIKDVSDYPIAKFIIENTSYYPDYDSFSGAQKELGDDGIVVAVAQRSPMQKMLIEFMGVERFSIDAYENPKEFKELAELIEWKDDEMYKIIANSPAELVIAGENLSGDVVSPRLFKEYSVPFHNKQARLLHEKDKVYGVHMDGRLNCIKDLIKETEIDLIESFTFPEGGGTLALEEARKLWKDKIIWANFPACLCHENKEKIKEFMIQLSKRVTLGDGFLLELSEDLPPVIWQKVMSVIADALK